MSKKKEALDGYMNQYDSLHDLWISTSALSTLMTCGISFYRKYILREREPGTVRRTIGSGTHKGRELNLTQKIDTDQDLPLDVCTDAARDAVEEEFDTMEIQVEKEFEGKSLKDAKGIAIDMATEIATVDREIFHPELHPTAVEKAYAVEYPGLERVIVGKVDVEQGDTIIDFKTSKRAYGQAKVDDSMQLSTYAMLKYASDGVMPGEMLVQNVVKGSKEAKTEMYSTSRTLDDLQRQLNRFAAWEKLINAGDFAPCDPSNWKCSPEWCGFWPTCPFGGGK